MIKKIFLSLLFVLFFTGSIYGDSKWDEKWRIQARFAEFIPVNSRFREIYGRCSPAYEIEVSKSLCSSIDFWGNLGGYSKKGRSIGLHTRTRINMANFSFGGKYVYNLTCQNQIYIGLGAVISDLWIKNHVHSGRQKASKCVFGGVLKFGVNHFFNERFFIDLFADYYYQPVHFETHVDVGGLKTGVGLGYQF